jgi:predicted esterase
MTGWRITAVCCVLAALAFASAEAQANKGSCGGGGPRGELHYDFAPSEYYLYVPESYSDDEPMPLFVALHGDEGDPALSIVYWWPAVWRAHGDFILLVPRAPYEGGSWWRDVTGHEAWLSSLIDQILLEYNIDMDQMRLYGHSGGATFLSAFALAHQDMYASVGFCIGGAPTSYVEPPSPECRIPAKLVTGEDDFLLDYVIGLYDMLESRGHEVDLLVQPGVGHDVTDECINVMYDWLTARTLCGTTRPNDCAGAPDADVDVEPASDASTDSIPADVFDDGPPPGSSMEGSCGCGIVW